MCYNIVNLVPRKLLTSNHNRTEHKKPSPDSLEMNKRIQDAQNIHLYPYEPYSLVPAYPVISVRWPFLINTVVLHSANTVVLHSALLSPPTDN